MDSEKLKELKDIKRNWSVHPTWLLKLLSNGKYNKNITLKRVTLTSQQLKILSLVLLTIIMYASYSINDYKPTTIVWIGVGIFVAFILLVWLMIAFTIYSNFKIKKICKKYDITVQEWNNIKV